MPYRLTVRWVWDSAQKQPGSGYPSYATTRFFKDYPDYDAAFEESKKFGGHGVTKDGQGYTEEVSIDPIRYEPPAIFSALARRMQA